MDEVDWTGKNQVTLHLSNQTGSSPIRVTVLRARREVGSHQRCRETDHASLKDTYTLRHLRRLNPDLPADLRGYPWR